jgi:DNA-binding transcriptional regulator YiaG
MPNIAQVLKEEIRRLAKHEAKVLITTIKSDVVKLKKSSVQLRRQLAQLTKDNALLMKSSTSVSQAIIPVPSSIPENVRFGSKSVKSLRRRLKLTQMEFGKLVGVTNLTISNWETKGSGLTLKDKFKAAIFGLRNMNAKEARMRLDLLKGKVEKKGKKLRVVKVKRAVKIVKKAKGKKGKK